MIFEKNVGRKISSNLKEIYSQSIRIIKIGPISGRSRLTYEIENDE